MNPTTPKRPTYLYLTEEHRDGYYHLKASVVTDTPDGIRNTEWIGEAGRGVFVQDLQVYSQGDARRLNDDGSPNLYAWEVEFKPYTVDAQLATRMLQTFKVLERKRSKLAEQFGRPVTFGQYCGRVALALGIDGFIVPKRPFVSTSYAEREHRHFTLADGIAQVDFMVAQWAKREN